MSGINSAYGGSEDGRWIHLHADECTDSFETIYPIVERVTSLLSGKTPTKPELIKFIKESIEEDNPGKLDDKSKTKKAKSLIKEYGLNRDLSGIPIAAPSIVNDAYNVFAILTDPRRPRYIDNSGDCTIYDFDRGIIPDKIKEQLKIRCFGFYHHVLGITREEHYRMVMEEITKVGQPIKGRQRSDSVILREGSKIIIKPGFRYDKLGIHSKYNLERFSGIFSFLYKRPERKRKYSIPLSLSSNRDDTKTGIPLH